MENTNTQAPISTEEINAPIMPIGWDDSVDIFDDSWLKSSAATTDESAAEDTAQAESTDTDSQEESQDSANDTEVTDSDESKDENDGQLATQDDGNVQPRKIKFNVTVNHKDEDVELDESEVPELYQQAQGLKSARKKLDSMAPIYKKAEFLTELLGYSNIDEMLDEAQKSYEESKTQKLIKENVHPDVAKDIIKREVKDIEEKVNLARQEKENQVETEGPKKGSDQRDFKPEVAALLKKYPSLKGQTLPQEVVDKSVKTGEPLVAVYAEYINGQKEAENERLRKENKTLKQNAEAANRAPVKSVTQGGAAETAPDDDFLKGFNRY